MDDISYLFFYMKNEKLWNYLLSLGFELDNSDIDEDDYPGLFDLEYDVTEDGVFSNGTRIMLPSGIKGYLDEESASEIYGVQAFESISEWLITVLKENYLWYEDGDDDDGDDDDGEKTWKLSEAENELSQIFTGDRISVMASMDAAIENAHIEYERGFETEVYVCEEVDIQNGIRTITTPEIDFEYERELGDEFDFDGVPGEVIIQKWEKGHWVTTTMPIHDMDEPQSDLLT